ncbi:MAG: hypothetical protein WBA42_21400 [Mesorhizobium sp.]
MTPLPIDAATWTVFFASGVAMAALGYEYRQRPVFSDPGHWTNGLAFSVMCVGRAVVFAAVVLHVAGQVS